METTKEMPKKKVDKAKLEKSIKEKMEALNNQKTINKNEKRI
jgi:hypothetical protein